MAKQPRKKSKKSTSSSAKKNKLGVTNSLVNNINARRKQGKSRSKSKKTVSSKSYKGLKNGWA